VAGVAAGEKTRVRDSACLAAGDTAGGAAGGNDLARLAAGDTARLTAGDTARLTAGDTTCVAAGGANMAGVATGAGASSADLAGVAAGDGKNTSSPPFIYLRLIWFIVRGYWTAIFDVKIEFIGFTGHFVRRTNSFEEGDRVDRVGGPPLCTVSQRDI
jgi:hypothetical protein